jgi:hypothetical protein
MQRLDGKSLFPERRAANAAASSSGLFDNGRRSLYERNSSSKLLPRNLALGGVRDSAHGKASSKIQGLVDSHFYDMCANSCALTLAGKVAN